MSATRKRCWQYLLLCDEDGCRRGREFLGGGSPLDAEFLRSTIETREAGWVHDADNDRDLCPDHAGTNGRGSDA